MEDYYWRDRRGKVREVKLLFDLAYLKLKRHWFIEPEYYSDTTVNTHLIPRAPTAGHLQDIILYKDWFEISHLEGVWDRLQKITSY